MTIYEIKERTSKTAPYFFDRRTMKFFNQTLKDFSVIKQEDGRYRISAPCKLHSMRNHHETVRFFNPDNNKLELK